MGIDGTQRSLADLVRRLACDSSVIIIGRTIEIRIRYLSHRNLYALISSIKNVKAMMLKL